MRSYLALVLFVFGCSTQASAPTAPTYDSVRDRLADTATTLLVAATPNAGTLGASHYASGGWQSGTAALSITDGELVAALDGSGALAASAFELSFAPIDVPMDVFDEPAQLTGVQLQLAAPASAAIAWTDPDAGTATLSLTLSLSWALSLNGGVTPLAAQKLPPIALDVAVNGTGNDVAAELALHADGELWSWADLLELTGIYVNADAATAGN